MIWREKPQLNIDFLFADLKTYQSEKQLPRTLEDDLPKDMEKVADPEVANPDQQPALGVGKKDGPNWSLLFSSSFSFPFFMCTSFFLMN